MPGPVAARVVVTADVPEAVPGVDPEAVPEVLVDPGVVEVPAWAAAVPTNVDPVVVGATSKSSSRPS